MEILPILSPEESLVTVLVAFLLFGLGMYILEACMYYSIYKKSGYEYAWLAFIPIAQLVPMFQIGERSAWNIAWCLFPFLGPIIFIIYWIKSVWKVFEKAGYDGELSLLMLIPIANLIMLAVVAWEKKEYPRVKEY